MRMSAGDRELNVSVRGSGPAQTMRIIVGPRRPIEAIVPAATPDAIVEAFLTSKQGSIERKVAVAEEIAREESPGSTASRCGSSILVGCLRGRSRMMREPGVRLLLQIVREGLPRKWEKTAGNADHVNLRMLVNSGLVVTCGDDRYVASSELRTGLILALTAGQGAKALRPLLSR
jgi:hypothetical protein